MSEKYPEIPHFPFSPGVARDDKINYNYWDKITKELMIFTEKLDGENTCINKHGVYARSHSGPTQSPCASYLKPKWAAIKNELANLEIFGENLYAIHSIEYTQLKHYFYVFAIRELDKWLSWEEVNFYAQYFDFPIVPLVTSNIFPGTMSKKQFEDTVIAYAKRPSLLGGEREGLVVRVEREFRNGEFKESVFKWVRQSHVKTDKHWTKNWKKAKLFKDY